jgi:hypothetical protein
MDGISTRRMNTYLLLKKRLKPGSSQSFFRALRPTVSINFSGLVRNRKE